MPTNWPTSVWNPQDPLADDQGMAPFSIMDPGTAVLHGRGLTNDVYQEHKGDISDSSIRAWDVMENPFYQAMAEYEGYDWDKLVSQFNEEIGSIEDQPHSIPLRSQGASFIGGHTNPVTHPGGYSPHQLSVPGMIHNYETFDNYADAEAWAEENDYDVSDITMTSDIQHEATTSGGGRNPFGGPAVGYGPNGPYSTTGIGGGMAGSFLAQLRGEDGDARYWGITDEKWVERFDDWTEAGESLIKKYKRQDAPLIRKGPSAADYGIVREDNNIFTHYGLDRPPAAPTELATNYKWNLSKTWKSDVSYVVPPDLTRVNLSGDEAPRSATITPT